MPFIDPQTVHNPASGLRPPAAWGDTVRANQQWFAGGHPRARVFTSVPVSVADSTVQAVPFNGERFDAGGCHSTASNTSRLTVPAGGAGLYQIVGGGRFGGGAAGVRNVLIRLNGTTFIAAGPMVTGSSTIDNDVAVSTLFELAAGDFVELCAFQTSGGPLNLLASSSPGYFTEFAFTWLADLA